VRAAAVGVAGAALAGAVRPGAAADASPAVTGPLAAPESSSTSRVTPDWARAALSRMSAAEVVACLPGGWLGVARAAAGGGAAAVPWLFPGALEAVAAAHIVAGFVGRDPEAVAAGEAILTSSGEAGAGGASVAPALAARVLLGDPDGAAALLAAQSSSLASAGPGPAVPAGPGRGGDAVAHAAARARAASAEAEWVAAKSGGGGAAAADPLPGLVSLTEEWLARAAFPAFVDTAAAPPPSPSLAAYFDDPAVGAALDDRAGLASEAGPLGRLAVAGRAAGRAARSARRAVSAALARRAPAPALILPAVPGARAQALAPPVRILEAGVAGSGGAKGAGVRAAKPAPSPLTAVAVGAAVLAAAAVSRVPAPGTTPGGRIVGVPGPAVARSSGGLRLPKVVGGRAAAAQAAAAAAAGTTPAAAWAARVASFLPGGGSRTAAPAPVPTVAQAHAAIAAWQAAKADALGPRHATDRLSAAAAEPWRSAVARDAAAAANAGWFWVFRLRSLKVDGVAPARPPPGAAAAAVAVARLREAGDLFARTGKRSDGHSYDNAYAAEYTLVREAAGETEGGAARAAPRWKVAGVLVTGDGQ